MRTYTITEAADVTGMSRKAIARRVERGSLRSVVRNGRRRIPRSELVRAGLLPEGAQPTPDGGPASPFLPHPAFSGGSGESRGGEDMLAGLFREVLDRLDRQSQEIAQYRALTVQAESLRLTNELADLRVRLAELESQPPPQTPQPSQVRDVPQTPAAVGDLGRRVSELSRQVDQLSRREIWLPPQAATTPAPQQARPKPMAARPATPQTPVPAPIARAPGISRSKRFVLEAAFIVAVAVIAWQAELPIPAIAVAMALAWTLVAVVEWFSSR